MWIFVALVLYSCDSCFYAEESRVERENEAVTVALLMTKGIYCFLIFHISVQISYP